MELVYLWVEEYKNIKEQGFNFSPRFDCDFDGENLTIEEKKDYLSIFPDNINVTAIVGENGSGKSTILQLLQGKEISFFNHIIVIKKEREIFTYKLKHKKRNDEFITEIDEKVNSIEHKTTLTINIEKEMIRSCENKKIDIFSSLLYSSSPIPATILTDKTVVDTYNLSIYDNETYIKDRAEQIKNVFYMIKSKAIFNSLFNLPIYVSIDLTTPNIINDIKDNRLKNFIKTFSSFGNKYIIDKDEIPINEYIREVKKLEKDFFKFDWLPMLSTGEEKYLFQLATYYFHIKEVIKHKNLLICIDEGEMALHPNWQKKYINYLITFLKNNFPEKRIHIILSSHSPFIISDLPKENVIFLEKGIQKKPLKEKEQTFGTNIHTLLSHGFFMEDGLMGEFAKGKIEEIKKFYEVIKKLEEKILLNNRTKKLAKKSFEKRKKRFKHTQSIIGEPFLQTVIKNYLDELEVIFNGKKQFIQDEIKRLQELESSL